jgi:hypothetical protein
VKKEAGRFILRLLLPSILTFYYVDFAICSILNIIPLHPLALLHSQRLTTLYDIPTYNSNLLSDLKSYSRYQSHKNHSNILMNVRYLWMKSLLYIWVIHQIVCAILRLNTLFARKSFSLIVISMLVQRGSRGTPVLSLKLGKDYLIWSTGRTTFLTLREWTVFHHACGWTLLQFVGAIKSHLLSCSNSFIVTNSQLLLIITYRPALYTYSYSPSSLPSRQ